ncbi:nuclear transport factor 2 family protein [Pseudoalteromonas sp. MMG012]|uniref:nuclear transport factor 2 family protein n=1 Tax=Pseudoalteromonas sp. MMG012 TaxID=2822686 RepID=UPI001B39FF34|nr:nuclear transport factor 2 family protein [Pseudoalteromonas sp. MMG012]MBQ4848544.1 nuclear transport factor 2 family protein [Pseudoalteromonas sp. MMG012]
MQVADDQNKDFAAVEHVLQCYFEGLYQGDAEKLKVIFHPDVWLKAPGVRRSLVQWLNDVDKRPVPAHINQPYAFQILAVDVVKDQAMAKVHCPIFEFDYIDFLGLLKEDGKWQVVSKMYTDLKGQ